MLLAKYFDVVTTLLVLSAGGFETNPLMIFLLALDPLLFVVLNFDFAIVYSFLVLKGISSMVVLEKPLMKFAKYLFSAVAVISFWPAINNFIVLMILRN